MSDSVIQAFDGNPVEFDNLRKILAAGLLGGGVGASAAALLADKSVSEAKAAYDVGSGKCDEQDAIEDLIDRGVARASVWIQGNGAELCEKGCMIAATWLGAKLTPVFGPKAIVVCKAVGEFIGKKVGEIGTKLIDEGTRKIGACIKKLYSKAKEAVVEFAKEKLSKIFG